MSTFFAKYSDRIIPEPNSGCWFWMGTTSRDYGRLYVGSKAYQSVHRVAYCLDKGPIPEGLHIDHLCHIRCCCNPDHLEAVTQAENNLRMRKHRFYSRTHCKHGHLLANKGTYFLACRREVQCLQCKLDGGRRAYLKRMGRI